MQAVLGAAFPVFALILTGYLCARRGLLGPAATDSLNRFVVFLALPAQLFLAMSRVTWRELDQPGYLAAFAAGIIVVFFGSLASERRAGRSLGDAGIEGLCAGYANTGFMGIPLCLICFGEAGLAPAIVSTMLTLFLLFAIALALMELDHRRDGSIGDTALRVGVALLRNPLVLAPTVGGLWAIGGLHLPLPLARFVTLLADAATPCALVDVGLFLAETQAGGGLPVIRLVLFKLLVQPAVTAVLVLRVFAMPALWADAAILLSALPVGTGPFMLAKLYDREPALASRCILISTLCSVVTVSALIAWLRHG